MTVPAQNPINTSTGNGVTVVFPYAFKILAESDLLVTVDGVEMVLNTDYTVSGVGSATGGNVTFISGAPANGDEVVRRRQMAVARTIDYTDQGGLPASTLNEDMDRLVMMIQQTDDETSEASALAAAASAGEAAASAAASAANVGANNTAITTAVEIDVVRASTTTIGGLASNKVRITGGGTINSFGTTYNGPVFVRAGSATTINHNATTLILPGAQPLYLAAGDTLVAWPKASAGVADGWVVFGGNSAPPFFLGDGSSSVAPGNDITGYGTETGMSSGTFTAARTGYYQLNAEFERTVGGTTGTSVAAIMVNGSARFKAKCYFTSGDAVAEVFSCGGLALMNAGQTAIARNVSGTGSFTSVKCNIFSGFLVKGF